MINMVEFQPLPCLFCGYAADPVLLDLDDYESWRDGALVHDIWPEATPEWRELLISGTHSECWEAQDWGDEDE